MESGTIQTSEKTEVACIHARDRSTGRSEVAACVRVAEVHALYLLEVACPLVASSVFRCLPGWMAGIFSLHQSDLVVTW